jgi:hypothetical protein
VSKTGRPFLIAVATETVDPYSIDDVVWPVALNATAVSGGLDEYVNGMIKPRSFRGLVS